MTNHPDNLFDTMFSRAPVMVILRGESPEKTIELGRKALAAGITSIEIPLQSDDAARALGLAIEVLSAEGATVGAGTITSPELAERAHELGAEFTVAPGFSAATAERSVALGMGHLPGVASGTEVQAALALGLTWHKAFPATVLSLGWFAAMRGPFPQVKFVATGGIDRTNAMAFLDTGARAVSIGTSFQAFSASDLENLLSPRKPG